MIEVFLFLLLPVCRLGWRPALERRGRGARRRRARTALERESAVSVPPPRPPPALAHLHLTALTPQSENIGHLS
ncbi:hypothetical protein I79_007925 [Cricetulus griseus]|uniref:Uncharacterized protein n=1 Tax=Cricetulus griseus TaxID=10029 RepID=G3HBX4_CRIGR|nr:hypothetical protein I79_007925 [Cricetulus griseus]